MNMWSVVNVSVSAESTVARLLSVLLSVQSSQVVYFRETTEGAFHFAGDEGREG